MYRLSSTKLELAFSHHHKPLTLDLWMHCFDKFASKHKPIGYIYNIYIYTLNGYIF